MPGRILSLAIAVATLVHTSVVFAQIVKPSVLLERKSLKVVADETFPKNLSCEVYLGSFLAGKNVLGSKEAQIFDAEGKNGRIDQASMHIGFRASVSVFQKDESKDSYVLQLLLNDKSGVSSLFDLNLDGEWDVKMTPLKADKYFIRLNSKWIKVTKIDGVKLKNPTATIGRKKYVFKNGWMAVSKTP